MFSSTLVTAAALLLAATSAGARRVCYDQTELLYCYNGEFDTPQEVDPADVTYIAAYLRAYGRETRNGRLLNMNMADAADCGEWSLYARGTALAVAKKVNMTYDSSVLFEDVANTIDGGTGAIRRNGIHRCGADGGSLGVVVNATHPSYSLPSYVDSGAKPAGIVIKIVANLLNIPDGKMAHMLPPDDHMTRRAIATTCPRSYLFCVVADVGHHPDIDTEADTVAVACRPLAITYRQGHGHAPAHGNHASGQRVRHALDDAARAVAVLTHPANRPALEAERARAVAWYRHREKNPGRADADAGDGEVEVPDAPQPPFEMQYKGHWPEPTGRPDRPELPCRPDPCEFPFTSTCLRLALTGDDLYHTRYGDVQEQPLRCVFRADKLEYGLVVLDISDLDDLRCGFVAPAVRYTAEIAPVWDPVEDLPLTHPPTPELETSLSRTPMSASGFMTKFGLYESSLPLARLKQHRVVARHALDYVWPGHSSGPARSPNLQDDGDLEPIIDLILSEAAEVGGPDVAHAHRACIDLPGFQARLTERLRARPDGLRGLSASPLLRLAYTNTSHLNLAGFTGLTFEAVATSLRSEELSVTRALSLGIDDDDCSGSLEALLDALSETDAVTHVFFLAHPGRSDDELSSRVFAQICSSPFASKILPCKDVKITGAFSAPLRRKPWLVDARGDRLVSEHLIRASPVQHMFVRQQLTDRTGPEGREAGHPPRFRPLHLFLGDGLLRPERLVSGFLRYCIRLHSDRFLTSFAACPSGRTPADEPFPGAAVTPIPAENLAVPEWCDLSSPSPSQAADGGDPEKALECWPVFTGLDPGGWVLVVSHEWYVGPQTLSRRANLVRRRIPTDAAFGVPVIRYAFLRAKQPGTDAAEVVGDLKSFLREAGGPNDDGRGDVDVSWVDALVARTASSIRETWQLEQLPPELEPVMVMDDDTARSVFADFVEDAAYIRENVRTAMQQGHSDNKRNWYPSLLNESEQQRAAAPRKRRRASRTAEADASKSRNTAVFGTLRDLDVPWPNALGADRPATPPESFPWLPGEASPDEDL
ncbi:hypothetical protein CkaCkLH20_09787 [Colletotrichum karsti]|uniref:Uncharacterized protein n=1 Tax=Colletotrichum karsti TaxID=1095194 RepID=A0A9P6LGJ7_9PEZI|nr:uncharacterized protein CkaCkLH20_09787 [Colletotrichum karsti]KAF9872608.1 hypothetical protein CkaCkLH20_09787 [Colletotrichum karsti]